MFTVCSFKEWSDAKKAAVEVADIVCDECGGWGSVDCCECEREHDCPECDGGGSVSGYKNISDRDYFLEVLADIREACAFCGRDFLDEAADFIRQLRNHSRYHRYYREPKRPG
jgi:hypothetical protein